MTSADRPLSVAFEESENAGSNTSANPTFGDIVAERLSRRDLMHGLLAVAVAETAIGPLALGASQRAHAAEAYPVDATRFSFDELAVAPNSETHHVASGYDADVLISWGDRVLADAPEFDPHALTPAAQAKQFGYNNDFLGFVPLDGRSDHGLLVVNHEYTNGELMFRGIGGRSDKDNAFAGRDQRHRRRRDDGARRLRHRDQARGRQVVRRAQLEVCAAHHGRDADAHLRTGRRPPAHEDVRRPSRHARCAA